MEERCIQGVALSEGIAIAFPYFLYLKKESPLSSYVIDPNEIEQEIGRYRRALSASRAELEMLHHNLMEEGSSEVATIVYSHLQILDDPFLTTEMEKKIRELQRNTESVVHTMLSNYEERFSRISDAFFKERLSDVKGLAMRVLEHLHSNTRNAVSCNVPNEMILMTHELTLLLCVDADEKNICGFVTEIGGATSHAALIARAKGLPYVTGIDVRALSKEKIEIMIVDGQSGQIILSPNADTIKKYRTRQEELHQSLQELKKGVRYQEACELGHPVRIWINIGNAKEVEQVDDLAFHGVGLFRTEFLLFQNPELLMEEEQQVAVYREVSRKLKGRPLTIRVFDLGRDKDLARISTGAYEGIRFLLHHEEVFLIQLRSILRATQEGPVRLLLPLVAILDELRAAKRMILRAEESLREEKLPFASPISVGCMIELPEAVDNCEDLARESDFLSIGTNDLTHYALGINRSRATTSDVFLAAHPVILRMIKKVRSIAKTYDKPVTVCGEAVTYTQFLSLLLGLEIEEISCCARSLVKIRQVLHHLTFSDMKHIAQQALLLETPEQVLALLARQNP